MKSVTDKVAFIAGAASGIGLGIAGTLLDAGMKAVLADLRQPLRDLHPFVLNLDKRCRSHVRRALQ